MINLVIVGAIVLIYCMRKKKAEQEAGMKEWNSGVNTTGKDVELIGNETKRNYL